MHTGLIGGIGVAATGVYYQRPVAAVVAGAEAIVLAGTDLNLAFDGQNPGYLVIDALDVHLAAPFPAGVIAPVQYGERIKGVAVYLNVAQLILPKF